MSRAGIGVKDCFGAVDGDRNHRGVSQRRQNDAQSKGFDPGQRSVGQFVTIADSKLSNVPVALRWLGDKPMVSIGSIDLADLRHTFWEDSIRSARIDRIVALDQVEIDVLQPRLHGQIFHMTRCGSTALLQQFGRIEGVAVLSEPMIFFELLGRNLPDRQLAKVRLRQLLSLFQAAFSPLASRLVVKWPTLLCHYVQLLQEAFPDAPAVFIHRNPVEVLASIEARPLGNVDVLPAKWRTGPGQVPPPESISQLANVAQLLAANCQWIGQARTIRTIDFRQLPTVGWERVAPHFKIDLSDSDVRQMVAASKYNAKRPQDRFESDSNQKEQAISDAARNLAETLIAPALALALKNMSAL